MLIYTFIFCHSLSPPCPQIIFIWQFTSHHHHPNKFIWGSKSLQYIVDGNYELIQEEIQDISYLLNIVTFSLSSLKLMFLIFQIFCCVLELNTTVLLKHYCFVDTEGSVHYISIECVRNFLPSAKLLYLCYLYFVFL